MKTRFLLWSLPAGLGLALAFTPGCNSTPASAVTPAGLWSCFDTGAGIACVKQTALSTASADVNGDGIPDTFVCADDNDDGHDRGRDRDQAGHAVSGADDDHDGIDDDLDCGARAGCQDLTDDDNPERHGGAEVEADGGHGGDDGSGHGGSGHDGGGHDDGVEMHTDGTCTSPSP
jgi:hypothetical protein